MISVHICLVNIRVSEHFYYHRIFSLSDIETCLDYVRMYYTIRFKQFSACVKQSKSQHTFVLDKNTIS